MIPESAFSGLQILNVSDGDSRLTFDRGDPAEIEHGRKVIGDMLKAGYMIFVVQDDKLVRVEAFDPEKFEYVIRAGSGNANTEAPASTAETPAEAPPRKRGRTKKRTVRIPAKRTRAIAVPRTSGG